jgi:lysophospholipase L1-like esterase
MFHNYLPAKNDAFRRNYQRLRDEGYKNIYFIESDGLDGSEDDGTVDGIHLTDLGFRHYADHLLPHLRQILGW